MTRRLQQDLRLHTQVGDYCSHLHAALVGARVASKFLTLPIVDLDGGRGQEKRNQELASVQLTTRTS
jgi:hypothetical protein